MKHGNPRPFWTRRQVLQGGTAAGVGAALLPALHGAQAENRPNIVWIMADDMGYADTSFTGQPSFNTPHIDRIAREVGRLERHHAALP
jgi:hypothetical protein